MKKIRNYWAHTPGYNCFGCSPDNPHGLHMEFYEDGEEIISTWQPTHDAQGWIDTLHGGIQATLADEIASWGVFHKLQSTGVVVAAGPAAAAEEEKTEFNIELTEVGAEKVKVIKVVG